MVRMILLFAGAYLNTFKDQEEIGQEYFTLKFTVLDNFYFFSDVFTNVTLSNTNFTSVRKTDTKTENDEFL